MTTPLQHAIQILQEHVVPSDTRLEALEDKLRALRAENSSLRARAEFGEKVCASVQQTLRSRGHDADTFPANSGSLAARVDEALRRPDYERDRATQEAREAALAHEDARQNLLHHTSCMVQLYNKAATNILFGHGEKPDFLQLRMAIEEAVRALAHDLKEQLR
jgi:phage shock protein A